MKCKCIKQNEDNTTSDIVRFKVGEIYNYSYYDNNKFIYHIKKKDSIGYICRIDKFNEYFIDEVEYRNTQINEILLT